MTVTVSSGTIGIGYTISSGGRLVVLSGGVVETPTILSGGFAILSSGAVASAATVSSGGTIIGAGELEDGSIIGGDVRDVTVVSGGVIYLEGTAEDVTLTQSSYLYVQGKGDASSTRVSSGSVLDIIGYGSGARVSSGGEELIDYVGFGTGDVVMVGGLLVLKGSVRDEEVLSGATLELDDALTTNITAGAVAFSMAVNGVEVSKGASIALGDVNIDSHATAFLAGTSAGYLTVLSGGALSGPGVIKGGLVQGWIAGVTLSSGELTLQSGGIARGLIVGAGARMAVSSGAVASTTLVNSGGKVIVSSGGVASRSTISSGGAEYVYSGGQADLDSVPNGGREIVSAGGLSEHALLAAGGTLSALSSGIVSGASVSSGGREVVSSGGLANGTAVLSGGVEFLYNGGSGLGATVSSGGKEIISLSGIASQIEVLSGGVLIDNGQVLIAGDGALRRRALGLGRDHRGRGGDLLLSGDGEKFAGKAVISGGMIELATAGRAGQRARWFSSRHRCRLGDAADRRGGRAQGGRDLRQLTLQLQRSERRYRSGGLAFVAGATATLSSSTLVLSEGGKTYRFNLGGSLAAGYVAASDGHGGTLIDPAVLAMTQAMAGFDPSPAATAGPISAATPSSQPLFTHARATHG